MLFLLLLTASMTPALLLLFFNSLICPSNSVAPVVISSLTPQAPLLLLLAAFVALSNAVPPVVNSLYDPSTVAPVFNSLPPNTVAPLVNSSLFLTTSQSPSRTATQC